MAFENSLNKSMDKAVEHYPSLFTLPSLRRILSFLAAICIGGGLLFSVALFPSVDGLAIGLIFGFSLFIIDLLSISFTNKVIFKRDPIYVVRRVAALSLFCWVLWFMFTFIGVAIGVLAKDSSLWVKLCLLGFSAVLVLRLIVFNSTSVLGFKRILAASLLQPFLCLIPFYLFWRTNFATPSTFLFLVYSPIISIFSSYSFIFLLNGVGKKYLGASSLSIFKAFLINWIEGSNAPFEEVLEKLGKKQDVDVSMIKFDSSEPKAVVVVPSIHPGPFKNIGSSLLPSMLKAALEKELGCVACVPHGLFGHELDLASHIQSQKIINHVTAAANFKASEAKASPFVKASNGLATASCQIFGKFAIVSFTLAPRTTEDLPQELGLFVKQEAEKLGLDCGAVVNAHNSIDGVVDAQEALGSLKDVASACLERAVALKRVPFEVGAATVMPKEFSLEDGMGLGGISVVVVKVGEQKTAYVVIDGNNMASGLREKILSALQSIGVEGEVFTTDTHAVNAVVLNKRGYHPVGDAMNHEKLIGYIKEATLASLSSLERSRASCRIETVSDIKVIGEKQLETLCSLTDRTLQRAKKVVVPIFAATGLILMLLLAFIFG